MRKLAFLFVLGAIVSCNTLEEDTSQNEEETTTPLLGLPIEVDNVEVTDSTIILKFEKVPIPK